MKFFFDNNISEHLAHGMREFGEDVAHLKDHFPQDASDTEWLQYVGENDIVLVTRDEAIRWRPAELFAVRRFKVGAFFLGGKTLNRCQLIQQVVRNWPRIKEMAASESRPFAIRVPPNGTKFTKLNL
jgi:predicted nuclease of predicted toxin-antitoxin system